MTAHEASLRTTRWISPNRRNFLRGFAAAGAFGRFFLGSSSFAEAVPASGVEAPFEGPHSEKTTADGDESIRPFRIDFPDEALVDLRRRIAATNWPELRMFIPNSYLPTGSLRVSTLRRGN